MGLLLCLLGTGVLVTVEDEVSELVRRIESRPRRNSLVDTENDDRSRREADRKRVDFPLER
jgi:hypothetical protein